MYKIIVEPKAKETLDNFISSYKNIFKKRFFDSGIENEDIIIWFYIQKWELIRKEIDLEIKLLLSSNEIFWYKLYENWEKSVKIYLKSFMLEVYFEEDDEERIRFIEKIIINKK